MVKPRIVAVVVCVIAKGYGDCFVHIPTLCGCEILPRGR